MKIKFSTLILLGILLALNAHATNRRGDKEGNGGGAIVCTNTDGTIISAKLLDLREAEKKKHGIARSTILKEVQLEDALKKLSAGGPDLVAKMRDILSTLDSKIVPPEAGKRLAPPTDTDMTLLDEPRNCSLEGVASYSDLTETLTVDPVIFAAMSPTDQAALKFHEALYKVWRMSSAQVTDSVQVRNLTGAVFSSEALSMTSPLAGTEKATHLCGNQDNSFFLIPLQEGRLRLQFVKIDGQGLLDLTVFDSAVAGLNAYLSQGTLVAATIARDDDPGVKSSTLGVDTTSFWQPSFHVSFTDTVQYESAPQLGADYLVENEFFSFSTAVCTDDALDSKIKCRKL